MKDRIKSPVVLSAVVAQILTILVTLGVIDVGQSDVITAVVASVLQLFVVFGVLNNPTSKNEF